MKIIKNQKNYKVKALLESDNSSDLVSAFWETMHEIVFQDENIEYINSSYSNLASSYGKNNTRNPQKDFKKILAELDDAGWDSDSLNRLFAKHGDSMADDYNNDRGNVPLTGMVDYFMYKMTNGQTLLMGYNTKDIYTDTKGDEAFFKFYYGYNKTPYGRLAMEQHFGSLDKFFDFLGETFKGFLKTGERSDLIMGQESFMEAIDNMGIKDLGQHYTYDKLKNIGKLDLKAAGVDIDSEDVVRDRRGMPMDTVHQDGSRTHDPDHEIVSPANMYQLVVEFMSSTGFTVEGGKPEYSSQMGTNGKATIEDGVVTMYYGSGNE